MDEGVKAGLVGVLLDEEWRRHGPRNNRRYSLRTRWGVGAHWPLRARLGAIHAAGLGLSRTSDTLSPRTDGRMVDVSPNY